MSHDRHPTTTVVSGVALWGSTTNMVQQFFDSLEGGRYVPIDEAEFMPGLWTGCSYERTPERSEDGRRVRGAADHS